MDHKLVTVYDCDIIQGALILNEINQNYLDREEHMFILLIMRCS